MPTRPDNKTSPATQDSLSLPALKGEVSRGNAMNKTQNNYASCVSKRGIQNDLPINGPFESFGYSDDDLKEAYIKELDFVCDFFNQEILPSLIKNMIIDIRRYSNISSSKKNQNIINQLINAESKKDYSSFYMNSSFFDYKFSLTFKVHASFCSMKESSQKMKTCALKSHDFKNMIDNINSFHQMFFDCSLIHFRTGFHDFMTDTLRHEVSHAIVFIYISALTHAVTGKCLNISSHGKEWKNIAKSMGATPKACVEGKVGNERQTNIRDVDIVIKYYKSMDDISHLTKRRPLAKKKAVYVYDCRCSFHDLSSKRHNDIKKGEIFSCNKCGNIIRYTGKKELVY